MSRPDSKPLTIAVRVYPESVTTEQTTRKNEFVSCPNAMLVFDTETRTDGTQRLMFGSYQFVVDGKCLEEGLFHADDLFPGERPVIEQYVATHEATSVSPPRKLRLLTLHQFRERVYRDIYKSRCLLVGFNLPFDVARLAYDVTDARGRFAGGFSFGLWTYMDKIGVQRANQYRPRIGIIEYHII